MKTSTVKHDKNYYGVCKGRKIGIFTEWSVCDKAVNKYPNAVFKGFCTLQEAIHFLLADNSFTNCCKIPVVLIEDCVRSVAEYDHECGNKNSFAPQMTRKKCLEKLMNVQ